MVSGSMCGKGAVLVARDHLPYDRTDEAGSGPEPWPCWRLSLGSAAGGRPFIGRTDGSAIRLTRPYRSLALAVRCFRRGFVGGGGGSEGWVVSSGLLLSSGPAWSTALWVEIYRSAVGSNRRESERVRGLVAGRCAVGRVATRQSDMFQPRQGEPQCGLRRESSPDYLGFLLSIRSIRDLE